MEKVCVFHVIADKLILLLALESFNWQIFKKKEALMSMQFEDSEKVGNVLVRQIGTNSKDDPVYSDGPVEKELHCGFQKNANYGDIDNGYTFPSWAHEYHLSPVRRNLLEWFPFDPEGCVLEVGAGCGALTGLLCNKLRHVTALEYSRQRALVIAQRYSDNSNLDVVIGGFQNFETNKLYDYITVIGVLEYAGRFYGGSNPYESFLCKSRKLIKNNGVLILAIENKIGLKYIAGAPEDHTGRIFDSIYDYPFNSGVRTFCKNELTDLLNSAGFQNLTWYYPLPDYKLPKAILSDQVVPGDLDSVWDLYPARTGSVPRKEIIAEKRFAKTMARAGLFDQMANSFLVICTMNEMSESTRCLRFDGADLGRKTEFRINKRILTDGSEKTFVKSADNSQAVRFMRGFVEREALAKEFFLGRAEVVTARLKDSSLYYPYLYMATLEELIAKAITEGASDFGKSLIVEYMRFIRSLPSRLCIPEEFMREFEIPRHEISKSVRCFTCAPIDCIPRNIMVGEKKWYIIDLEWMYGFAMPVDLLVYRAIFSLVCDLQAHIQAAASERRPVTLFSGYRNPHYVPLTWLDMLGDIEIPLKRLSVWTSKFQNNAMLIQSPPPRIRLKSNNRAFTHVDVSETRTETDTIYHLRRFLWKVTRRLWRGK